MGTRRPAAAGKPADERLGQRGRGDAGTFRHGSEVARRGGKVTSCHPRRAPLALGKGTQERCACEWIPSLVLGSPGMTVSLQNSQKARHVDAAVLPSRNRLEQGNGKSRLLCQ